MVEDENGNTIMADMVNTGDDPKALKDCIVGAISVDDYDLEEGGLTVLFPGGITVGTKEAGRSCSLRRTDGFV